MTAIFGHQFPKNTGNYPPYLSLTFVKGESSPDANDPGKQWDLSVAGLIWTYAALGEYCDVNGQEGYQPNSTDYLISAATWKDTTWRPVTSGQRSTATGNIYWARLVDTTGTFTYECRLSGDKRVDNGITVQPFSLKCDIVLNMTSFWSNDAGNVKNCNDSNRYPVLLSYLAAASANIQNGRVSNTDKEGQNGVVVNGGDALFKWKHVFEDADTGVEHSVNAQVTDITADFTFPTQVKAVKQIIFSFISPKSSTNNYNWDPEYGINPDVEDTASAGSVLQAVFSVVIVLVAALSWLENVKI